MRHNAVPGRAQPRMRKRCTSTAPPVARASPMASRLASRSRSPPSGRYGCSTNLPTPRGRTGPRRLTSRNKRPAKRLASSRSFGSVAAVRSASNAIVSSGSACNASSTAASSSSPTSGDTCSKRGLRDRSRRDMVLRALSLTAASASSPSLVTGRGAPPSGLRLFPMCLHRLHHPTGQPDQRSPATARR